MSSNLTSTMLAMAGAMARKSGIELVIDPSAKTFSTDGNRLRIPPIAKLTEDFPELQELETYIVGAVIHEAGHIRYTDRDLRVAFKKSYAGHAKYAMIDSIGQCLEDVVIERAQSNSLPGARPALTKLWKLLYGRHTAAEGDIHEDAAFRNFVFFRARHSFLKTEWSLAACDAVFQQLAEKFTSEQIALFESELALLDLISTTADAAQLSGRLLALVGVKPNVDADRSMPEAQQGSTEQPEDGDGQPANEQEDTAQAKADDGEPQDASADESDQSTGESESHSQAGNEGDGDSQGSLGTSDENPSDVAESAGSQPDGNTEFAMDDATSSMFQNDPLDLISIAVQELQSELPEGTEYENSVFVVVPGNGLAKKDFERKHQGGMALKSRILMHTMMASARLSTLLKAQTESKTQFAKRGQIVPSRLWKLQAGSTRVFRQTVEGKELNTAIKVLLDRSGSMHQTMQQAIEAACFLPMAFDDVFGISTSIDIFPGVMRNSESLKRFEDRTLPCLDALASVNASGCTPLGGALEISGMELVQFNAERRILVVITDGQPDRLDEAKAQIKALEAADVEIIGIGIGVSLKHLISDFVSVSHVGELTNTLYHLMERKMIRLPLAA